MEIFLKTEENASYKRNIAGGLKAAQKNPSSRSDFAAKSDIRAVKTVELVALLPSAFGSYSLVLRADTFHTVLRRQAKKLQNKTLNLTKINLRIEGLFYLIQAGRIL